jgi:hypothetical protein
MTEEPCPNCYITSPAESIISELKLCSPQGSEKSYLNSKNETEAPSSASGKVVSKLNHHQMQNIEVLNPDEQYINNMPNETVVPKLNPCKIHRDGSYFKRIRNMQKKIGDAFESLLQQLQNIPEPDGSQDLMRRHKRAVEFSTRFTRNYLYHLHQEVCT